MLHPLKHLQGKLNHLQIPPKHYLRVVELANSLRTAPNSSLQSVTADQILTLKSPTQHLDTRHYHKFQFDYQVHSQSALYSTPSTIFDDLGPHERKLSHLLWNYSSKLNTRQLLYLNLALRSKINSQFPTWHTLHLTPASPSKYDLEILPTLSSASRLTQLQSLPKKTVMKEILKAKQH